MARSELGFIVGFLSSAEADLAKRTERAFRIRPLAARSRSHDLDRPQ
jgi:hypothetical protein